MEFRFFLSGGEKVEKKNVRVVTNAKQLEISLTFPFVLSSTCRAITPRLSEGVARGRAQMFLPMFVNLAHFLVVFFFFFLVLLLRSGRAKNAKVGIFL